MRNVNAIYAASRPPSQIATLSIPAGSRGQFTSGIMNDDFQPAGYQPESSQTPKERVHSQPPQYHPQLQAGGSGSFRYPARPVRRKVNKEERSERKDRYDRIEALTRELSMAVRDEMQRRKALWDVEGDREEEEFWEGRKREVYHGLEILADEIQRAFRDRRKEAVLELWSKEQEERRVAASGARSERSRRNSRRDEG